MIAEIAMGLLVSAIVRQARADNRAHPRLLLSPFLSIALAVVGCLCVLLLFAQGELIDRFTHSRSIALCPATTIDCSPAGIRSRLFLTWSGIAIGVEGVLVLLTWALASVIRGHSHEQPRAEMHQPM